MYQLGRHCPEWQWKLENFEGDRDHKFGVKGGYSLKNSSVLVHLFSACGKFCYFSWFFFHFLDFSPLFSFLFGILGQGGTSPSLKILGGTLPPPVLMAHALTQCAHPHPVHPVVYFVICFSVLTLNQGIILTLVIVLCFSSVLQYKKQYLVLSVLCMQAAE